MFEFDWILHSHLDLKLSAEFVLIFNSAFIYKLILRSQILTIFILIFKNEVFNSKILRFEP